MRVSGTRPISSASSVSWFCHLFNRFWGLIDGFRFRDGRLYGVLNRLFTSRFSRLFDGLDRSLFDSFGLLRYSLLFRHGRLFHSIGSFRLSFFFWLFRSGCHGFGRKHVRPEYPSAGTGALDGIEIDPAFLRQFPGDR